MYKKIAWFPTGYDTIIVKSYDELTDEEKELNRKFAFTIMRNDYSGQVYHNIKITSFHHCEKNIEPTKIQGNIYYFFYLCICPFCKNEFVAEIQDVKSGHKLSCGCKYNDHSDEINYPKFKSIYHDMVTRCTNKNAGTYKYFGALGINICNEWNLYSNFKKDMFEEYKHHVNKFGESNTVLNLIDRRKDFSKSNCKFITKEESNIINGQSKLITYRGNQYPMSSILNIFADSSFTQTRFRDKMRRSKFFDPNTYTINDPSVFVDRVSRDSYKEKLNLTNPIKITSDVNKIEQYKNMMNNLPKFN